jgi:hypothetical protein
LYDLTTIRNDNYSYHEWEYGQYVGGGMQFNYQNISTSHALVWKIYTYSTQYGWAEPLEDFMDLLKHQYVPDYASIFDDHGGLTVANRTTFFIAGLSLAFDFDTRPDFLALNFPFNNALYADLLDLWQGPPPPVIVEMTPLNPPIVIPANGGQFQFNATVERTQAPATPFYAWARNRYPNGTYSGILLGPVNINPPVGVTVTRQRTQVVPSSWPSGVNHYIGYANTTVSYPPIDADSFSWTKSTTEDGGAEVWEVCNYGEPFPGEEIPPLSRGDRGDLVVTSPNPFNASTTISYELRAASYTVLKVYDISGSLVSTLVDGWRKAGTHQVAFDGSKLASGLYFVRMQAGNFTAVRKMALVK